MRKVYDIKNKISTENSFEKKLINAKRQRKTRNAFKKAAS